MEISGMIGWRNMDNKMYNPELKEAFLSTYYKGKTRKSTSYVFSYSCDLEYKYQKDLKDFEKDELNELLVKLAKWTTENNFSNRFSVV
ncbi:MULTISPECIES: hypothetical protein [unclassified Geobacillus]|nr:MULTISPECIES: hypothetical protein [unclassified Geobacillus]TXK85498.1 hypothetical protein FVE68_16085 [Geobacillus sp. AYS3]TXK89655.1 hypothetical protein FVE24_15895 [Parageobacillus sp. SY1]